MNANMAYGFTETELDIARHTDLPDLLSSLGYTLKRIGSYYTTAEMGDSRPVYTTISRLREKIEDVPSRPKIIVARRGRGYVFTGKT